MNDNDTPREMYFSGLLFGDRYRFAGDHWGTGYATVTGTQEHLDGHFSVDLADGSHHYGSSFRRVVLLHRAPACECGWHVAYCEAGCVWPDELVDLWQSLFGR